MKDKNYLLILIGALSITGTNNVNAQGANFSNVRVHSGAEMHIKYANNVSFGQNVTTNRTSETSLISFASLSQAGGATGFVDGRLKIYGNSGNVYFPTGNDMASAVTLTAVTNASQPVTALYSEESGGNPQLHDAQLFLVSEVENWMISGSNNARLKLSWGVMSGYDSTASAYSLGVGDATIAAWNGTQWVTIPSAADSGSTLQSGSISSTDAIDFSQFTLFTIAFKNGCAVIVAPTGTVTYNGAWSGNPDEYMNVVINTPVTVTSANSFSANSLVLNADITVEDGAYIDVVGNVEGSGKILLSNEASFVQRSSAGSGPQIQLEKNTRPLRKWDHAYWGTPVEEDFIAQIDNAKANGYQTAAFDQKLKYVSETGTAGSWQTLNEIVAGKGFITRVKSQPPFVDNTTTEVISFPISGTANNGNVSVELGSAVTGARSFNLLANPYPSAIDAGELLRSNPNLGGAIYLWTAKEFNNAGATADYAVWTMAGSVVTSPIAQQPTGYIASGQGFMVKGLTANGFVNFTNCMRVVGQNDNFFRTNPNAIDRYWLNLTNTAGIFSQILVNYTEEGTYGADRLYDAPRNSVSTAQLYSFIDNSKYAVNGRPVFDVQDTVPLGVSRTAADSEAFTIALDRKEGIFAQGEVTILLHDRLLGIYHNLNQAPYSFTASDLQNNDRFEIVYQAEAMGTDNPVATAAVMNISGATFSLTALSHVEEVTIFDLSGRIVQKYSVDNNSYSAPFSHAQGIYIAKAKMAGGTVVTQKLINGK